MKLRKIIVSAVFILSLSINAAFVIHMFGTHPGSSTENKGIPLDLTAGQKQQMEPIRIKTQKKNETIMQEMARCRSSLLEALRQDPVDRDTVYKCIDTISDLQKKIQLNTVEEIIQVRKYMSQHQCNCLINNLAVAMGEAPEPCNCGHCSNSSKKE